MIAAGAIAIAPDPITLLRLPVPYPVGHVNAYLLPGDPLTLVDCGTRTPEALTAIDVALALQGVALGEIELLILTHQHVDHTGLAATIHDRSGCAIAAHEHVADLMADEPAARAAEEAYEMALMRLHGMPEELVARVPEASIVARGHTASVNIDRRLRDGDVLRAGGRDLDVRLRPGHSPTDTLFVDSAGNALVADHLLEAGPSVVIAHRPPHGPDDPRSRPRTSLAYRNSLHELRDGAVRTAYAGHGAPIVDVPALVGERLAQQDRRAGRILQTLGDGARTAWDVVRGLARRDAGDDEHPVAMQFLLLSDVLAHVDLLVDAGLVHEHDDGEHRLFEPARIPTHSTGGSTT
jgi:glyoxylase-like metal-dependent hydrolase (beta-lactamase superfamily II)